MGAIAFDTVANLVANIGWSHGGLLATVARFIPLVLAIILYCRWLHSAYEDNRLLAGPPLKLRPGQAVGSFFIPIVHLYRPYQALRDLYRASDPRTLPDLPTYRVASSEVGYRSNAREIVPAPAWSMWCPLGLWWASYEVVPTILWLAALLHIGRWHVPNVGIDPMYVASAAVGIQVIRAIRARQKERLRRLEAASEEPQADAVSVPTRVAPLEAPSEPALDDDTAAEAEVSSGRKAAATGR